MADEWIKMRRNLLNHPKVVRISSALLADKFRTVGGLHAVWSVFDEFSVDGKLNGYSYSAMDVTIGWPGFCEAMAAVKWLDHDGESLVVPEFDEHNGASGKRRAQDAKSKRNRRHLSASNEDILPTKSGIEEEVEVDKKKEPSRKRAESSGVEIDTWLDSLPADADPIPSDDPIIDYAAKAGIPLDYLELAWDRFAEDYRNKRKRQKNWPATFRNAVKGNWGKLWWFTPDGECKLTTAGEQARRAAS